MPAEGPIEGLAVALLAAGHSSRFGDRDKLLAPLGGQPLLAWAAETGTQVPSRHRFLICGDDCVAGDIAPDYAQIFNPERASGMASSLRLAANAAQEAGAAALLVLLADMPFVDRGHLLTLIGASDDGTRPVFSVMDGIAQPPVLFPSACFAALSALEGDKGARSLSADAILVEAKAPLLLDIDTPDDLARAESLLATRA